MMSAKNEQAVCDCHTWPTAKELHDYTVACEQRIAELERENAQLKEQAEYPTRLQVEKHDLEQQVATLAAETRLRQEDLGAASKREALSAERIATLTAALEKARAGLESIAADPHTSYYHPETGNGQYGIGVTDGHRCAAMKARAALAALSEPQLSGEGKEDGDAPKRL